MSLSNHLNQFVFVSLNRQHVPVDLPKSYVGFLKSDDNGILQMAPFAGITEERGLDHALGDVLLSVIHSKDQHRAPVSINSNSVVDVKTVINPDLIRIATSKEEFISLVKKGHIHPDEKDLLAKVVINAHPKNTEWYAVSEGKLSKSFSDSELGEFILLHHRTGRSPDLFHGSMKPVTLLRVPGQKELSEALSFPKGKLI
jgi:hypothetical protein